jgi:hypothetical protein
MLERAVICNSSSTKSLTNRGQMIFTQTLVQTHTNYNWHDNFQHDSNTTQACALNMLGLDTLPPLKVWKCHISSGGMTAGAKGKLTRLNRACSNWDFAFRKSCVSKKTEETWETRAGQTSGKYKHKQPVLYNYDQFLVMNFDQTFRFIIWKINNMQQSQITKDRLDTCSKKKISIFQPNTHQKGEMKLTIPPQPQKPPLPLHPSSVTKISLAPAPHKSLICLLLCSIP